MRNLNLKEILKSLKLNESTISMVLGAVVIVVIGALVVNYFRNVDTGLIFPGDNGASVEDSQGLNLPADHTVGTGDTLWSIAERYYKSGYNWVDVASANSLDSPDAIETGQKLSIPDVEPMQPTIAQVAGAEASAISGATYTVSQGDSLWEIAVRAYGDGYRWSEIASENRLSNPDVIHSGNILILPR